MNIWIWPVTRENWPTVKSEKIWAVRIKGKGKRVFKGDKIIFYVNKTLHFHGSYEVKNDWHEPTLKWPDEEHVGDSVAAEIGLTEIQLGFASYDKLVLDLNFVEKKSGHLKSLYLRGTKTGPANLGRPISADDYKRILNELKQNQQKPAGKKTLELPDPNTKQYSIKNISEDGCFVEEPELKSILAMLKSKKNLILQGPPGTGKTYLAKKLAFALIGCKPDLGVRVVQFHPNLSYEDFVRGWRPSRNDDGGNGLNLVDGPFLKMIKDAKKEPKRKFVMVIEEINRGNPANILGEMLTLLEADKRGSEEALTLSYMQDGDEPVYIPENLHVIGTMNVADRSIALVDLALRRRFGFYNLEPVFNKTWKDWVRKKCDVDATILDKIKDCMMDLNQTIEEDGLLGPHFKVGHSYVTPTGKIEDPEEWFKGIVRNEIGPLLDEYWIEEPDKARDATRKLLERFEN